MTSDADIRDTILTLAMMRGADKTFCPSEAARQINPENWRDLMPDIRRVAARMPEIAVTQKGEPIDAAIAKGPIRLGLTRKHQHPG